MLNRDNNEDDGIDLHSSTNNLTNTFSTTVIYPKVITLDIGGHKFKTVPNTLRSGSGLFHRQLSDNYTWSPQADGSYFMDADPDLFAHLLRFMRRPEIFPLFYTKANGFDYDLYNRLEAEAEYFQMDDLREWIQDKKYLKAVVTVIRSPMFDDLDELRTDTINANETEDRETTPRTRRVYICPRDIAAHRGRPKKCGVACNRARGSNRDRYMDEDYVEVVSVRKEVKFRREVCRLG
jgi:hypothetical protein